LVVALVLQLGVLYHSQNVVTAAAQTGLEQARTETGTVKGGEDGALKFISVAAPDFIRKPVAQATVDDTQATVRVAGEAYPILPGLKLHVTAVATAPRERFVRGG